MNLYTNQSLEGKVTRANPSDKSLAGGGQIRANEVYSLSNEHVAG